MASLPPTKKAKVVSATADNAVSSTGLDLSPELIARVTTFASVWTPDVWNTCLAVGPGVSRTIRHCYLKSNTDFLEKTLENFHSRRWNKAKARTNHLAWMAANSDWRDKITDERMEDLKEACSREDIDLWIGRYQHKVHSHLAFNNPVIAIQLGLLDVLKYLVEEKLVDINSHQWTGYFCPRNGPLLCYCAGCDVGKTPWEQDLETYHYLLGLPSLDIVEHVDRLFASLFLFPFERKHVYYRSALPFIRGLVQNSAFSQCISDRLITIGVEKESPLCFLLWKLVGILVKPEMFGPVDVPAFEDIYDCAKILLEAGADPKRRNISAAKYWKGQREYMMESNFFKSAREKSRAEYWDKVEFLLESYG